MATAGAVTATALAATIALGANMGLFGLAGASDGPGDLSVVEKGAKPVRTEVIDIPVPVSAGGAPSGTPVTASTSPSRPDTTTLTSPHYDDDDGEHEEPEHEEPEHEDEDD
jgi:hypothetical protein